LTNVAEALRFLNSLQLLDLSNCGPLESLTLYSAQTLILENSGLTELKITGSVINLKAANNNLTNFSIADPKSVIEMDLHGNRIDSFEGLFKMQNLQRLDLSKNIIGMAIVDKENLTIKCKEAGFHKMEKWVSYAKSLYKELAMNCIEEGFISAQNISYLSPEILDCIGFKAQKFAEFPSFYFKTLIAILLFLTVANTTVWWFLYKKSLPSRV